MYEQKLILFNIIIIHINVHITNNLKNTNKYRHKIHFFTVFFVLTLEVHFCKISLFNFPLTNSTSI